jgi:nucleoside-diphosphate-sugar epimerase
MSANIVVTGAGGFLGTHLLRKFIKQTDAVIYAVVRNKWSAQSADLQELGAGRVHLVTGDISSPNVARISTLPRIDEFWHLAGSTDFQRRDLAMSVNVMGTSNVLNLARRLDVRAFFHVSTAYVAGLHQGLVAEDTLLESPEFRNVYEESKYQGERIVRESGLPFIIMRPSIIMGDSVTGEAKSDKMVYGVLKLCERALRTLQKEYGRTIPSSVNYFIKGNRAASKNLIAIDDVTDLMLRVRQKGQVGKTYHLCNPLSTTIGEIHDCVQKALNINFLTAAPDYPDSHDIRQKMIDRGVRVYEPYVLHSDPVFDMSNTQSISNLAIKPVDNKLQCFLYERYVSHLRSFTPDRVERSTSYIPQIGTHGVHPILRKVRLASL